MSLFGPVSHDNLHIFVHNYSSGSRLTFWLDHYRRLQLQDGAFMAMLLDSYVVEVGQPWWLNLSLRIVLVVLFPFFCLPMVF